VHESAGVTVSVGPDPNQRRLLTDEERRELRKDWSTAFDQLLGAGSDVSGVRAPLVEQPTRAVASVSSVDVSNLLRRVLDEGGHLAINPDARAIHVAVVDLQDRPAELGSGPEVRWQIDIPLFHCHFDGDFANWTCHWGSEDLD